MRVILPALVVLLVISAGCVQEQKAAGKEVSFVTEDSVVIKGTLYAPFEDKPVIILVHQYEQNRNQWNEFIPVILDKGYSVLAYDIRGMGQSTKMSDGSNFARPASYFDDMPRDVRAAIEFIMQQDNIDKARIGIIGASVGGNVAYVSSGTFTQIRAAVSMSPSSERMTGSNILNFAPKRIFFMSDSSEARNTQLLHANTQEPKQIREYAGSGHGVALLENSRAVADIFEWLNSML